MLRALINAYIAGPDHRKKHRILRSLLPLLKGTALRSRYGVMMISRPADYTNFASLTGLAADYDDVFNEVSTLQPGEAFIDVGANAGLFSMVASQRVGGAGIVIAFEPSITVFRDLVTNATLNETRNFYPFNAAVGDRTGRLFFQTGKANHSGIGHLTANGDIAVCSLGDDTLTAILRALLEDRNVVIKIDVEGAEHLALTSLRPILADGKVRKIIAEIDDAYLQRFSTSAASLYAMLGDLGFVARRGLNAASHYNEIFERT